MSSPYQYYGSSSHMTADLKRVIRRVRANCPRMFDPKKFVTTSMDKDGKVTSNERVEVMAKAPTPSYRQHISWQKERY